jgi:hypothetical protein
MAPFTQARYRPLGEVPRQVSRFANGTSIVVCVGKRLVSQLRVGVARLIILAFFAVLDSQTFQNRAVCSRKTVHSYRLGEC